MYRLIEIDGNVSGFEYHEEGTLTEEQARNAVKYGTTTPTDSQVKELDDESAVFRSNKDPKYAAKMRRTMDIVRKRLGKKDE